MAMIFWDPKDQPELSGIYQGWINEIGRFKSRAYVFYDGTKRVHVWSNKRLTELLFGLPFKTKITIKYLGKVQQPGEKYATNDFSVEMLDENEEVSALDKSGEGELDLNDEPQQEKPKKQKRKAAPRRKKQG
jgi:hypothetical protein